MFVLNIERALRLRGIEQHYKFLIKQGFAPFSARTMLEGNAISIKFEHLERICLALNCTPNDLFEWHPAGSQNVAETHSMNSLRQKDLPQMLGEVPMEKLGRIIDLLNETETK